MELRQLRYFVAVAEDRHFGRAAGRLHVAQPALSQQIRNLERELDVQLLERASRPISLTPAGEAVLAEARHVLRRLEAAIERTKSAGRGKIGQLTIGFLGSVGHDLIPRLMTEYSRARPDVALHLEEIPFHEQQSAFRDRRLDVAFVRLPLDDPRTPTAVLREDPAVAIVPEGHTLASAPLLSFADLRDERWVLPARATWPAGWDWIQELCRRHGFTPDVAATATSLEVLAGLVAAREGVGFLPAASRALPRPGVAAVPLEDVTTTAAIAWRPDRDDAIVREFVERAIELARSTAGQPAAMG
jgi:DNA-binding transcriptional LysR family regulator